MIKSVVLRSSDLHIHGTLLVPDNSKKFPGVILFHGMTSSEKSYLPLANMLVKRGIAAFAITMRGHGESEGDFNKCTVTEALHDALAAYDFMINNVDVDKNKIAILGSSVGAILAAITSEKRQVETMVFRAPAVYTDQMMDLTFSEIMAKEANWFHQSINLKTTPAGRAISKFKGSLLVIASENDMVIPIEVSRGYIDIAESSNLTKLNILKGAPHVLGETKWKIEFDKIAFNWLKKLIQS
jgi:esterase/lipase